MTIEINAIQNFLTAFFALLLVVSVALFIKKLLKGPAKKSSQTPADEPHQESDQTESSRVDTINPNKIQEELDQTSYEKMIRETGRQAKSLLYETAKEAGHILSETRQTSEHMEEDLDKVLQQAAANEIHSLKETLAHFDQNTNQNLQNVQTQLQTAMNQLLEETKKHYDTKLDEFMQQLLNKGLTSTSEVDKKTAEMLATAEGEIAEYKKSKMSQIDEQVTSLIQKVYRDVLRMSMSENTHQELIVKSLEQAKKDGLFKL